MESGKRIRNIIDRMVETDYEFLAVFDMVSGVFTDVIASEGIFMPPPVGTVYDDTMVNAFTQLIVPEELDEALKAMSYQKICQELLGNNTYSVAFSTKTDGQGEPARKLWKFTFLDENRDKVLYCRSDITEVYKREQEKNAILDAALLAAEQANAAKTDFLSRMSHEIRTPMNAIIGMSAIAASALGDDEQVADCLSKIGISSRFLLSLINDILDMSRIESGKMLLKSDKIPFEEFIHGVNTVIAPQCNHKDVDYECVVAPTLDAFYMGDATKLSQVLVNILGNAAKFTDEGGRVSLQVYEVRRTKHDATLRFVINDTGCGIGEDFMPKLFEPFEQEETGATAMYSGTGLGLAISKNIVNMMDGHINVRSIKGLGTEFTVDVKLGVTKEALAHRAKKINYHFDHLKTLVVDDDIAVCESAMITLKEMGIEAEWVDSGRKAVDCVTKKWEENKSYDMILVDWKMPEMDGIETTRRIRKIVGPEVTIIIMTAYDWSAIEHEAKMAGVNMLMNKPMFKSSLISAFSRAMGKKEEEKKVNAVPEYDFTGKRVLLAEDHPLNVEVASKLLTQKGFTVEHAPNGLKAMELFTLSHQGYYDVILMDIRMPVMDGLQATRNIRHLSNADARTIPIIAMTANAFENDVEKSKEAGMNAHLAKPIEPAQLYKTLADFLSSTQDNA